MFTLTGNSLGPGEVTETLSCRNTQGGGKSIKEVMVLHASASVAVPYVEFNKTSLGFTYSYEPGVPLVSQTQPLTMKNISALPLSFSMHTSAPFSIDRPDWLLEPDESATVNVIFDAGYRNDKESHVARCKLNIVYSDNPQRDTVDLSGEINFPNLSMSTSKITFGAVLNDTTRRSHVTMKNVSSVPCRYNWVFVEDVPDPAAEESLATTTKGRGSTIVLNKVSPEQVFDLLPIRGYLLPGQEETVEVSYFAQANSRIGATAVCEVEGGPEYDVALGAEAAAIKYTLDTSLVNIGSTPFDRAVDRDVTLSNSGKVTFPFEVLTSSLTRPYILDISPTRGKLAAGEKVTLKMHITAGIPEKIAEFITLEVAHFEPIRIEIVGEGVYPAVALSLPRDVDDAFTPYVQEARALLLSSTQAPSAPGSVGQSGSVCSGAMQIHSGGS